MSPVTLQKCARLCAIAFTAVFLMKVLGESAGEFGSAMGKAGGRLAELSKVKDAFADAVSRDGSIDPGKFAHSFCAASAGDGDLGSCESEVIGSLRGEAGIQQDSEGEQ